MMLEAAIINGKRGRSKSAIREFKKRCGLWTSRLREFDETGIAHEEYSVSVERPTMGIFFSSRSLEGQYSDMRLKDPSPKWTKESN
jgi:hypothetical protein